MALADKIRPYVDEIKQASKEGDKRAKEIITLYGMHVSCPSDPAAPALCEAAFEDWLKKQDRSSL